MKAESADKLVKISSVIHEIYGEDLHKKRQQSIAFAAMGLLSSESLFLHRMAEGLVNTRGGDKKHAMRGLLRWYWHFVDVVWLFLFIFVYWL